MLFRLLSRHTGFLPAGSMLALGFVFGAMCFSHGRAAYAQTTYTYKGTTGTTGAPSDGNFFTGFNGFGNGLPQTSGSYGATDATFVFGGTSTYTAVDNLTSRLVLNVLQFTNVNTASSTEKVTLARGGSGTSNTLTFDAPFSNMARILLNNSGAVQVDLDMVFNQGTTISGSGSAIFTGALSSLGNGTFTYAGSSGSTLTLTGISNLATQQVYFNGGTTKILTSTGSATAASLSAGSFSYPAYIGNAANDNGTVSVSGVSAGGIASSLNAAMLYVGYQGMGTLNVTDGGMVKTTSEVVIAYERSSTGAMTVSGVNSANGTAVASTFNAGGFLTVGQSGSGTLNVLDGGKVIANINSAVFIAPTTGSTGTLTVSGVNTANGVPISSTLSIGGLNVGQSGTGTVNILDGAVANSASTSIAATGGTGIVTVSGVNTAGGIPIASTLNVTRFGLTVGSSGTGTLNISDGGVVNVVASNASTQIGANATGKGTLTVSGVNTATGTPLASTLNAGTYLFVGSHGTGTLNVTNGGKVTANYTFLSASSGSSSSLIINGGSLTTNSLGNYDGAVTTFKITNPANGGYALNIVGNSDNNINYDSNISAIISDAAAGDGASGSILGGPGGAGGIYKTGTATLTLTGASTFSGGVNIAGGTVVASSTGLGTGRTLLSSAGTLSVGSAVNTETTAQSVNTLTARSLFIIANGSSSQPQLTFNLGNSGSSDKLILTETDPSVFSSSGTFFIGFASATGVSLDAGQYTLMTFTGQSAMTNLPDINLFKATRTGNISSLNTGANPFQYILNGMGQQTLVFSIGGASVTPEPSSLLLLLWVGVPGGIIVCRLRWQRKIVK